MISLHTDILSVYQGKRKVELGVGLARYGNAKISSPLFPFLVSWVIYLGQETKELKRSNGIK